MIQDTQRQIIRQSSLKASIDFYKLKGVTDISEEDIIKTAYNFGYWCATGSKVGENNNKLLK
jgi:hypothetical protein|tara:strand:- start:425 stop:610 length:186 start_codon:yes stop_codon:yes gene_type:complete